jgi:hypothetical protein
MRGKLTGNATGWTFALVSSAQAPACWVDGGAAAAGDGDEMFMGQQGNWHGGPCSGHVVDGSELLDSGQRSAGWEGCRCRSRCGVQRRWAA